MVGYIVGNRKKDLNSMFSYKSVKKKKKKKKNNNNNNNNKK